MRQFHVVEGSGVVRAVGSDGTVKDSFTVRTKSGNGVFYLSLPSRIVVPAGWERFRLRVFVEVVPGSEVLD